MKVGDLVRWSETEGIWHTLHSWGADLVDVRQRGLIYDKNPKYFFVLWENGEQNANWPNDLEVVSEGR